MITKINEHIQKVMKEYLPKVKEVEDLVEISESNLTELYCKIEKMEDCYTWKLLESVELAEKTRAKFQEMTDFTPIEL